MSETAVDTTTTQPVVETTPTQPEVIGGMDRKVLESLIFEEPLPKPTQPEAQQPESTPEPATTEQAPAEPAAPDYTPFVKEFGFEKLEDFKAEFENLKKLKDQPKEQTAEEIKFANEQSKKVYEALLAGKTKEVKQYLQVQEMLEGYDTMSTEDKLKLQIKLKNPRFDDELVEDEYNALYSIDEDQFDDPMKLRKEKIRLQQRLENAALEADEFISKYKQKIELPEIEKQKQGIESDPDFEAYKDYQASTAELVEHVEKVIRPALMSVKENDVQMNFALKDENNQMDFQMAIDIKPEDLENARKAAFSWNEFFNSVTSDEKGDYSASKALQVILKLQNFDKYVTAAARQAVNAERARVLKEETPSSGEGRDYNIVKPNPREDVEKLVFHDSVMGRF